MSCPAETPNEKQCRIKTSVVLRLQKELQRYLEDLAAQKSKVVQMRAASADEYDVKKQVRRARRAEQ